MKKLLLLVTTIILIIATSLSGLWAAIEYINYLVKDTPFYWGSLWLFSATFLWMWVFLIWFMMQPEEKKPIYKSNNPYKRKSAFQKRLEEAENKRT